MPVLLAGLLFSACDRKKPEGYSKTILNIPDRARNAEDQADLVALRSVIKTYRLTNGRYPDDLATVAPMLNAPVDLGHYDYDPASGTVSIKQSGNR